MKLKILHTADWHLGQKFYDYDRNEEHVLFLKWLIETLVSEQIDVLLISGDVFDVANPSSAAQALFYKFLTEATTKVKGLQIIITAGNHDSASRLEAPATLMEAFNIRVCGSVKVVKHEDKDDIDTTSIFIPLCDRTGRTAAYCMAVPYLRSGDYEWSVTDEEKNYTNGIRSFYQKLYERMEEVNTANLPVIAMGHLHTSQAVLSDSERGIKGGLEVVAADSFHDDLAYVALGHIHKAQKVAGKDHICYSGSPIPMSFSEINYKHRVICIELEQNGDRNIKELIIPRTVDLIRIGTPAKPLPKEEVMAAIAELNDRNETVRDGEETRDPAFAPYLEVNVLLNAPDVFVVQEIKEAIKDKYVRLARNVAYYPGNKAGDDTEIENIESLKEISPKEIFEKYYQDKYNDAVPADLERLFEEVIHQIELEQQF